MKLEHIYNELVEIAKQHNIRIRKESGTFRGGACTVNEECHIILNKNAPLEVMNVIIAEHISTLDLTNVYLKPAVRDILER